MLNRACHQVQFVTKSRKGGGGALQSASARELLLCFVMTLPKKTGFAIRR